MTALLAVLAMAGYQNRDKLAELLGRATGGSSGPAGEGGRAGGQSSGNAALGSAGGIGGILAGGLQEIVDRFRQAGHGETAESWVRSGPNRAVQPTELETAIGPETLEALAQQTGLSRQEILARLTRELPEAVDKYTPDGRLPAA
jgi:uncharacterized protein YidB (DUF937 family)